MIDKQHSAATNPRKRCFPRYPLGAPLLPAEPAETPAAVKVPPRLCQVWVVGAGTSTHTYVFISFIKTAVTSSLTLRVAPALSGSSHTHTTHLSVD